MIQDKGLTAPRLTPQAIEAKIVNQTYTILPSGKVMVCELTLTNGYTVRARLLLLVKLTLMRKLVKQFLMLMQFTKYGNLKDTYYRKY